MFFQNIYYLNKYLYAFKATIFILCCIVIIPVQKVSASENYFLDGQQVLLYKILNWWYHAPEEEVDAICGSDITYIYNGGIYYKYDESTLVLTLQVEDGFADMLSVLTTDERKKRSVIINGTKGNVLSKKTGTPTLRIEENNLTSKYIFSFNQVDKSEYLNNIKGSLSLDFTLKGKVLGLRNGSVALYNARDNLYNCSNESVPKKDQPRLTLRISRKNANDILTEYIIK